VRLLEQGVERVILRYGTDADLTRILADPLTAISCDCGAGHDTTGHPRQWGAFPRFLGRFVREQKLVSWGEAVRKLTALPAAMVGLSERGYLLPGMIADVTVFDPETIEDRATIEAPELRSAGVRDVIVNGRLVLEDGRLTGTTAGAHLRRSQHEPTRPMSTGSERRVRVDATLLGTTTHIRMKVDQAAGAARPTGAIRVTGTARGGFVMRSPSIVQASEGWASVTGIARWDDAREDSVTVLTEQADPFAGGMPSVTVLADGAEVAAGTTMAGVIKIGYSYPN
jgi:N-acyl-D-amino-acid deacylase